MFWTLSGNTRRFFYLFALLLFFFPSPSEAVVTYDLLHDTIPARQMLKEEMSKAERPSSQSEGVEEQVVAHGVFEEIWFAREKYLQIGEHEKARTQINLLWEKEMERGVRNLPEYGEVLVRQVERNISGGHVDRAGEVVTMARRISPDGLPVYFAALSLARKKSFLNVGPAIQELVAAAKVLKKSFRLQSWAAANALAVVCAALLAFFAFSIAAMFLAYARRIAHDLAEVLPRRLSPTVRAGLGWVLLLSPALAGLPVWWWFIFWGVLLFPYVDRFPRVILVLAGIFLLSLPWQVRQASSLLSMHRQPLLERMVGVGEGHWTDEDYFVLKAARDNFEDEEGLASFFLGITAKRMGYFDEAEEAYMKALERSPQSAPIWNNLGNLSMIGKEYDLAIEHYKKSVGMDAGLFAPHYNLSLAYREKFLFPEGEAESRRAVEIDPDANAYYTSNSATHYNRYTVDVLPPLDSLWKYALRENKWQAATADHLWMSLMLVPSRGFWPFAIGGVLLVGLGWWAFRATSGPARHCEKCGRVFCSRCRTGKEEELCSQCHHIFVRKKGVDAKVRVGKLADIKKREQLGRIIRVVSSFLVPGGGHLVAGRVVAGTLFLLPASLFLAALVIGGKTFPATFHLSATAGWGSALPLFAVLVFLWALSLWQALHIEE